MVKLILWFFIGICTSSLFAEKVVENYPSSKPKISYTTDKDGKKQGPYFEYYENGRIKVRTQYLNDVIHGTYSEFDEKGKLTTDSIYQNGLILYPKSKNLLNQQLKEISASKPDKAKTKFTSTDFKSAINLLNSYRCIVGVDFDVELKDNYCELAQAGAELCNTIGRLDHTPKNPGLADNVFKLAYEGTSHSNLSMGTAMEKTPTSFMDDSDQSNIERVGHRRWCINPSMKYTGFGSKGAYSAMYSFDDSREKVANYDFIAFPARGFHPVEYFANHYAWNVSLHPDKYAVPHKNEVKVEIFKLEQTAKLPYQTEGKKPLELNFFNVDHSNIGIKNCIIFRPKDFVVTASSKYWVKISGLKTKANNATTVEYLVEFIK